MWQPLSIATSLLPGDTVRFAETNSFVDSQTTYQVVRADMHYFEIAPAPAESSAAERCWNRIVRYFDLGHTIRLEVWAS